MMCIIIFKIRAKVAYTWDQGGDSLDLIKQLYNEDSGFAKEVEFVKQRFINLFDGTNPNHQVADQIGTRAFITTVKNKRRLDQGYFMDVGQADSQNPYKRVAHLIKEDTDWMYRILILFARYELCTDPKFISYLESLQAY